MAIIFGSVLAVTTVATYSVIPYVNRKIYEGVTALICVAAKTGLSFIRRKM